MPCGALFLIGLGDIGFLLMHHLLSTHIRQGPDNTLQLWV